MRSGRLLTLVAVGAAGAFAACGGGSGDGGGTVGVPVLGGYERPPQASDPPGTTYENPGGGPDPTGSSGSCSPCDEDLLCDEGGGESVTIYLRHHDGDCLAFAEGEGPSDGVILGCGGSLTNVEGDESAGTWALGSGGIEFCETSEGESACVTCSTESYDDGGLDANTLVVPGFTADAK
jgi:hypothetical protein